MPRQRVLPPGCPVRQPSRRSRNPFPTNEGPGDGLASGRLAAASLESGGPADEHAAGGTLLVPSPRFKLQYAIEDAGPNGPASVGAVDHPGRRPDLDPPAAKIRTGSLPSMWTWAARGPSGSAWSRARPRALAISRRHPAIRPQSWVEVDSTPPAVQLYPPQIGTGPHAGKVAITWRASDLHLAPNSVSLLWRPDQPGAAWQPIIDGQENMGQYIWTVPPSFPAKFHIRVEAVDTARPSRLRPRRPTPAPVIVDRSRPRSRIIGLDPNARAGDGPGAAARIR